MKIKIMCLLFEPWNKKWKKVRLSQVVNFINIICTSFLCEILLPKITKLCFGFDIFWHHNIDEKSASKMLMKLTPEKQSCYCSLETGLKLGLVFFLKSMPDIFLDNKNILFPVDSKRCGTLVTFSIFQTHTLNLGG